MSLHDWKVAKRLRDYDVPFAGLIMAAVLRADTFNLERLRSAFPDLVREAEARYHAGGGLLAGDPGYDEVQAARADLGFPPT